MGVSRMAAHLRSVSGAMLKLTNADFCLLRRRPAKSANMSSKEETVCTASADPSMQNIVSSAY